MSELTKCNSCSLAGMQARAARRGATVTAKRLTSGEMAGWYEVRATDKPDPVAWFKELTVECCC